MGHIITDLKENFKRSDINLKFIYANAAVFLLTSLTGIGFMLFNRSAGFLLSWFELPASFPRFILQPWSLFTYMFMHADVLHILFNMLWLYWFGRIFLYFFSARHFRGLYILGGLCGGLLYMVAYNVFPYFSYSVGVSMLLGASASVLAIVVAVACREPNYAIQLMFIGNVKLKYLALFMVATDLLLMTGGNAGGHIAHLGGALAGLWFASALSKGHDITAWLNRLIDGCSNLFSRKGTSRKKKAKMKVHYGDRAQDYDYNAQKKEQSDEIDRILEKLKQSGYESLTAEEKRKLFDASNS